MMIQVQANFAVCEICRAKIEVTTLSDKPASWTMLVFKNARSGQFFNLLACDGSVTRTVLGAMGEPIGCKAILERLERLLGDVRGEIR